MISVQPYSPEHASNVVSVILPIQQLEFGVPITLDAQPDLKDIPGHYQTNAGNFWVAVDGATVVGTIGLLDIGNRQAALRKMFVAASHRGPVHGVAKRLLDELMAWAALHGFAEVFLGTTDKFLAAQRFYEKNDFAELPKASLPATFPVMAVDSKFYRRALSVNVDSRSAQPNHQHQASRPGPAGSRNIV